MAKQKRAKVWDKTGGRCWYCGCEFAADIEMIVEHQTPKRRGGSSDLSNLVPACRACNSAKGQRTVREYREYKQWKAVGVERFTTSQIAYLQRSGIELPQPANYVFWGENVSTPLQAEGATQ